MVTLSFDIFTGELGKTLKTGDKALDSDKNRDKSIIII
jgi:hypothetical protein